MDSFDSIIDEILIREGGGKVTNDPTDSGGKTQWGISEKSNPEAWKDGKVTEQEARDIYFKKYVKGPGFDKIIDSNLQAQLVDFGVNSGPAIAIKKLQGAMKLFEQDGILGPNTLDNVRNWDPKVLNNLLVVARVKMICQIVKKNPSQLVYLNGWVERALSFLRY
jgi:lysozyme family protein